MLTMTRSRRSREDGAVAIMVAVGMTAFVVAAAFVLDFGLVRLDRQMNKSSADAATTAGLRGLDRDDGAPHPFSGVCQAIEFLRQSQPQFAALPTSGGNVSCPAPVNPDDDVCDPDDSTTWADYEATVGNVDVSIKSPYQMSDGGFPEESMSSLSSDTGKAALGGCDQIAVIITEAQRPGLGALATDSDLVSRIRTVGRVGIEGEPQNPVAMLLLEQNDCEVLSNSSNKTRVLVKGNMNKPGLIHSDSLGNGSGCSSRNIFYSQVSGGIVVEDSADGTKPGVVTVRALTGEPGAVPAEAEIVPAGSMVIEPSESPTGRELVSRSIVDDLYLEHVEAVKDDANQRFAISTALEAAAKNYTPLGCNPTALQTASPGKYWVDCSDFKASARFPEAQEVVFTGKVDSPSLRMPKATEVYIKGSSNTGLRVSEFRMHTFGASTCSPANDSSRARLVIRNGKLTHAGDTSVTQLCHTAVLLMGGSSQACLGMTYGGTGCTSGIVDINTGTLDWTAPDAAAADRDDSDFAELEDLALWAEASDQSHKLGGSMTLAGIFMVPNAEPFNINGIGSMNVENSQFIVRKFDLAGSGDFAMMPDPYDVITISLLSGFQLVR